MRSGIVLTSDEIREILAEHFDVSIDNVIRAKYSYIIIDAKGKDIIKNE